MPGVHYLYATYLLDTHPDEAEAEFRKEIELNPSNGDAHAMLALVLSNGGDFAGSLEQAKKATEEEKSPDALTQYAYGEALARTGATKQAVPPLEDAVRMDPEMLGYHLALVGVYSKVGRNDDARRERKTALEMAGGQRVDH